MAKEDRIIDRSVSSETIKNLSKVQKYQNC